MHLFMSILTKKPKILICIMLMHYVSIYASIYPISSLSNLLSLALDHIDTHVMQNIYFAAIYIIYYTIGFIEDINKNINK